jgi:hypothetical protein
MARGKINVRKAIASVNASMAVEGLKPSKTAESLGRQYLEGKITADEAITKAKARFTAATGKLHER